MTNKIRFFHIQILPPLRFRSISQKSAKQNVRGQLSLNPPEYKYSHDNSPFLRFDKAPFDVIYFYLPCDKAANFLR